MTTFMLCHIENGHTYPLPQFDDTHNRAEAVYDLMTVLDRLICETALQDDHNLTVTPMAVHVVAPDDEYTIAVVEIPWVD